MTPQTPRVLVAASGSLATGQATAVAADLASTFEAQLVVLHVVPPVEYRVGRLAPTLPITRQLDDPLSNQVLMDARRVAWTRGASAKAILVAGDPALVIVAVARELGADLLVIGSTPRLVPSSLAAKTRLWTSAHAPCPVLPVTANKSSAGRPAIEPVLAPPSSRRNAEPFAEMRARAFEPGDDLLALGDQLDDLHLEVRKRWNGLTQRFATSANSPAAI